MKKTQIENFVKCKHEGSIFDSYGPFQLNDLEVWEVWVIENGLYETRFVTVDNNSIGYFSDFQQFAIFIDKRYQKLNSDIKDLKDKLQEKKIQNHQILVRLYVAAVVFLISVAGLLYLTFKNIAPNIYTFGVLGSVIASGGTMFFGAWIQVRLSGGGNAENIDAQMK